MVKISKPARNDLRQIHQYIAEVSLYYAKEVVQSIIQQIKQIEKFPNIGRTVPELNDETIREIIHDSYRIVYRVRDIIEVAAVIHAKRDFKEAFKDR
jgi:plasmid stabilization system protein ParE